MTMRRLFGPIPVLAVLFTASLWSTSVRVVNLPEMMQVSTRIFRGRCLSAKTLQESPIGLPVVEYTFQITNGLKGVKTGDRLVFRQVQASQRGLHGLPGVPSYRKGDDVVLFLAGDSEVGLTSPVGLGQGLFTLKETPQGLMAVNEVRNKNLTVGLESSKASAMGLSDGEFGLLTRGGEIPLESFMSVVRKIDDAQLKNGRVQ